MSTYWALSASIFSAARTCMSLLMFCCRTNLSLAFCN